MNDRSQSEKFQDVTIHRGWLVAARSIAPGQYQSVVVDPWDLEVGNSIGSYQTVAMALSEGHKWIDRYLVDRNGT